jgi:serine/threonine protein kinase/tetratricopeptide (TPR) repeat protein
MGEFEERERLRKIAASSAGSSAGPKDQANAVQTPPPDSAGNFDSEAPTLLDPSGAFDAATVIEIPAPHEALTALESPIGRAVSRPASAPQSTSWNAPLLLPTGTVLANRYEILQLLGEGGMGAVYKARDTELDRVIALKVIRPELASNPEILQRFKQELVLARQVTDRNIIRIFDLGEADGIRFITMEYVEGTSLYQILREQGKLPVKESAEIIEQVLIGLRAAHREGIIHRDLKPGNIMRDQQGRILVMDFGLARSLESDGMTKTGAVLGTMEYMSPEQAMGSELDPRSDLFTVGLILFELLTGKMPFKAETALASLLKRVQERAVPLSSLDNTIPAPVERIVAKCLERDVNQRYQTAQEMIDDLHRWQGDGAAATLQFPPVQTWGREIPWNWIGGSAAIIVLAIAGFLLRGKLFTTSTARTSGNPSSAAAPVSVLVADFQNNTSDTIFDGTLEPMFNVALEGASFINAFNRGTARQLAEKLPNPTSKLDEQAARLVAVSQGIGAILTGSLSSRGNGYQLSVKAIDAVTGKTLATEDLPAENKDQLLLDVPKLAAPIRKALGDTTPESVQLAAAQGTFVVSNLEAAHQYSIAMEQQSAGKLEEALKSFSKAVELDPNFARAYGGMAAVAGNLGQRQDAEKYAKLAMEHVDRMTERERYFVRGMYYIQTENWQKCVEEYSDLVKQYPADNFGHNNLAVCYGRLLNMQKAMDQARIGLQITPKDVMARMNFALYACYGGDFQACGQEAAHVTQVNPSYEEAYLVQAYSELGENDPSRAVETYQKMQKLGGLSASIAAAGLGDLALYQGRFREAVQIFEKGAAADLTAKKSDSAADKFAMLAYAQLLRGDKQAALLAGQKALGHNQSVKTQFLTARSFTEAGDTSRARKLGAALASSLQVSSQAYGKLILGEVALKGKDSRQAIQSFTEANNLLDTWIGRFDLGRAYLEAGAFAEADSEFDRCIKRRGEALELFMDDVPTYSYVPVVYYYQGRVREGLKSRNFAEFYKSYLNIRGKSAEDPLVSDIHHRLTQ